MWSKLSLLVATVLVATVLACAAAFSPATGAADWRIIPGVRVGAITSEATEADLVRVYGRNNVRRKNISLGEGEYEPGTVIFPDEPDRSAEILWKDETNRRNPERVRLSGTESLWKTAEGVGLGTTLRELERLNGRRFILAGFGWDYAGTVYSWRGGRLEKTFRAGKTFLRLTDQTKNKVTWREARSVLGDHEYQSNHPVMRKINPRVYEIVLEFD
jgi:hypothetical protein